jgi:hypothetical protein
MRCGVIRKLAGALGFCVIASAMVYAADFWETKPFPTWSDKELQSITSDSPWARKVIPPPPDPASDGSGGDRGGGGGRGGGGRGGGGGGRGPQQLSVIVMWRSALPMKEALVRSQIGVNGKVSADSQALLDRAETGYIVTAGGLPASMSRGADAMKAASFLKPGGKMPIAAEEALTQVVGSQLMLVFAFPKTTAITLEDKDVEFVTKIGGVEIKKKFNLKDLVYKGKLEL